MPKLLAVGLVLGAAATAVILVIDTTHDSPPTRRKAPEFAVPELNAQPRAAAPFQAKPIDPNTISDLARKMNIPQRALQAYATAETKLRASTPKCGISWTMLAGIGRKESRHGQYGGTTVGADGELSKPIIGVPLDGSPGVRAIKDTDHGQFDGDTVWDRAIGPMQFLPATWQKWSIRASDDGAPPDPQNMDDAALSAGRYLCAIGGDLTTSDGWWNAVLTYNTSVRYGQEVFNGQDAYARAT